MKTITTALILLISLQKFTRAGELPASSFIKNKGQWPAQVLYQGTFSATNVYFLKNEISFGQSGEEVKNPDGTEDHPCLVWNMRIADANTNPVITASGEKESVVSWISGNDPSRWIIHPEMYTQISYHSVFDHVDLHFYESARELKYDYIIHPGGKLDDVQATYRGIQKLSLNEKGDLQIQTPWNTQLQKAPVAWQMINGKKNPVQVSYAALNDSTFGFLAGDYDPGTDLVIDPLFQMVWCSYTQAIGTSNNLNYCFGSAMDKDGNVYLTGVVDGTFPTTPGAYSGAGTVFPDIFVAKFSSDGTTMLYSTYLPGNSSEHGVAIAVDDSGRAYVTGIVDLNFTGVTDYPSTSNAFQPVHDQGSDAFLTVLNPAGTALVYSSFLGGTGSETGYGIALGPAGIAYVAGSVTSGTFPVKATNAFPTGDVDVFVSKFDISQSGANSLVYSTRIGGGAFSYCKAKGIAVNSAGNAFITGTMGSGFGSPAYPTTAGAYSNTYNPGQDNIMSFVTKLSANTPVTLDYSTYLAPGTANSIAVENSSGDAFIAGTTYTFAFPVTAGALQGVHGGTYATDAFAVRLNATGTALVYSTFIGGPFYDYGTGIAVNSAGEAYVTGFAPDSFPVSAGAIQTANAGAEDFFAVHINASGTAYGCGGSTYIGGSDEDYSGSFYDYSSPRISIQDHGGNNDTICISSTTHSQDFPTTAGVYGPVKVNSIADQPVFFKLSCQSTTSLPAAAFVVPDSICPGACVDFVNQSQNGTSYQWTFQGASVSSSTDVNPAAICYPQSGTYQVMLIATNASGTDTATASVIVYPAPPPQGITQIGDTLFAIAGAVGYQWYFNGNIITGATNYFHVATSSGNYNVVASDVNGCEVEAVIFDVFTSATTFEKQLVFQVYPDPVMDKISIHMISPSAAGAGATIYNVWGERVKCFSIYGANTEQDLSELAGGIFFLEIKSNGNIYRERFIKE